MWVHPEMIGLALMVGFTCLLVLTSLLGTVDLGLHSMAMCLGGDDGLVHPRV